MFRIYGLDPQVELPTRKNFRQRVHPEDRNRVDERFARVVNERVDSFDEYRVLLPDGTVKHVNSSGHPVLDGNGEFIAFIGTATDVTERKRSEEALREREAKIRRLVDSNIIGIFITGLEGRVLEANDAFLRLVGHDRDDLVSGRIRWTDLTPPEWRERDKRALAELSSNTIARPYEKEFFRKDGSRVPVLVGGALFEEGGDEGVAFVLDLTDRKCAEEALRESEYKLRQIIETVPGLLWSTDPDGEPTQLSQRLLDYSGMQFEDFLHGGWEAFIHPDDFPETARAFNHAIQTGTSYQAVNRLRRVDGEFRWHQTRGEPLRDREGQIVQWYGLSVDIDERKKAEERLRRSESYLAEAQRLSHTGTWVLDARAMRYLHWSDEAYRIWGFDPPQGPPSRENMWQRIHPDDRDRVWGEVQEALRQKRDFSSEFRILLPDGTFKYLEAATYHVFSSSGALAEAVSTQIDVTERKRAQDEHERLVQLESDLAHMNRLSRMGELVASLIHEITQPIGSARNNARAALNFFDKQPQDLSEIREALGCIVGDADRAGQIVDRIRDHIKKAPLRKDRVDLNEAINEVIVLARSAIIKYGVSIQSRLAEGLVPVLVDRVQLQQVILNLILNAVEAMGSVECGARELLISAKQSKTNGIVVAVGDSGPGIDPENLERVFEAFYTTKSSGVGMGLSICRSIIGAHGGRLWADANEPRGAVFQFTLPNAENS